MEQIHIEITKDDEIELNKYYLKKHNTLGSKIFLTITACLIIAGMFFIVKASIDNKVQPLIILCIVIALLITFGFFMILPFISDKISTILNIIIRKLLPQTNTSDKRLYKITNEGLYGESKFGVVLISWEEIKFIDENKTHIFITSDKYGIHIIPKRYFESENQAAEFISVIANHNFKGRP